MAVSAAPLPDIDSREAFTGEVERPFSIIAPAGVGKTHAITERVLSLARRDDATEILPRLIVVTYTRRAAQEMQVRVRARILEARLGSEVEVALGQAFFGTIHSLCVRLLQMHGHALGLPPVPQLLEDEEAAWSAFWSNAAAEVVFRRERAYRELLQICPMPQVQALVRSLRPYAMPEGLEPLPERPSPVMDELLAFVPARKASAATVAASQASMTKFAEALREGGRFVSWPKSRCTAKDFLPVWEAALAPLRDWQRMVLTRLAGELANAAQEFRRARGELGYDDQIAFAAELLRLPEVAGQIRENRYLVILDEAQDTDPRQFEVLCGLAGWPDEAEEGLGRMVMVGDPQQSIYPGRADMETYLGKHASFAASGGQTAFEVTFRCDQRVVDWVNTVMPALLDGAGGQTRYYPLLSRSEAREGQVLRLPLEIPEGEAPTGVEDVSRESARQTAMYLQQVGLEGLQARNWGEVALLCPRRNQLTIMAEELRRIGLAVQVHSTNDIMGDHPVFAWLCAAVWCLAHSRDGFEVVGLLREVFGCSDHDLAMYRAGRNGVWRIDQAALPQGYAHVEASLNALHVAWQHANRAAVSDIPNLLEERIGLLSRLREMAAIVGMEQAEMDLEWQRLRMDAIDWEAGGKDLAGWSRRLKDGFERNRELTPGAPHAVQLLTCQKAKGLEWDAVVLSQFFQPLQERAAPYPRARQNAESGVPQVYFDKSDQPGDADPELALKQHYQRLLYVAMTRARHTLVLADDEALFSPAKGADKRPSMGRTLLGAEENRSHWEALPQAASPVLQLESETSGMDGAARGHAQEEVNGTLALARSRASAFARRTTPHSLAERPSPEEPEARQEAASMDEDLPGLPTRTPATLYGTWWHELMEVLPWQGGEAELQDAYRTALRESPDPERSRREWDLLQKAELWTVLRQPGMVCRSEMPMLWKVDAHRVVEGVVDLAVWEEVASRWWIIDWKTNRLEGSARQGLATLREEYEPQVQAYLDAWKAFFPQAKEIRGMLYATQLGQGVMVGEGR